MEFLKSIWLLLFGIVKRLYYLLPSLLSDPFDVAERWFGVTLQPPNWLFGLLLFIGLALAVALAYHEVRIQNIKLNNQLNNKTKMYDIREKLGEFISRAAILSNKCHNEREQPPKQEIDALGSEMDDYIRKNLGQAYIARMTSSSGLPVQVTSIQSMKHRELNSLLGKWRARLDQFISELSERK